MLNDLIAGTVVTELAQVSHFACSQSAIREALLRLEGEGIVCRAGRQGTRVSDLDADAAMRVIDLPRRIEVRAARRVARRVTAGVDAWLTLQPRMVAPAEAGAAWTLTECDRDFHLALFCVQRNPGAGADALYPAYLSLKALGSLPSASADTDRQAPPSDRGGVACRRRGFGRTFGYDRRTAKRRISEAA
jgi:hypothetical protein